MSKERNASSNSFGKNQVWNLTLNSYFGVSNVSAYLLVDYQFHSIIDLIDVKVIVEPPSM